MFFFIAHQSNNELFHPDVPSQHFEISWIMVHLCTSVETSRRIKLLVHQSNYDRLFILKTYFSILLARVRVVVTLGRY